MQLTDFDFNLSDDRIAYYPQAIRSQSKLLCVRENAYAEDRIFFDLIHLLNPGDLLVFNDTKVIPARLHGIKATGGKVELLVERILNHRELLAQVRASKAPLVDSLLLFAEGIQLRVLGREGQFFRLGVPGEESILSIVERLGQIPLPPYIKRAVELDDKERYQTVYALHKGSVAAPTAGLHFDAPLLTQLKAKGIEFGYLTLHIGAGTFQPVHAAQLENHRLHAERIDVSPTLCAQIAKTKAKGNRVIAVGTTTLRSLETAVVENQVREFSGETSLFIKPGHCFHSADVLITNLHLPQSTLLMLVCAFGGYDAVMKAYQHALVNHYRFYSYGDAMWIELAKFAP